MLRQAVAAALVMALANGLYEHPIPIDLTSPSNAIVSIVLFAGYLYLVRSVVRFPVAVWNFRSRYIHARKTYNLNRNEALTDGFLRGFMDRRRWETPILGNLERTLFALAVWWACKPTNTGIAQGIGVAGVLVLVILYMTNGSYRGLVDDGLFSSPERREPRSIPNLRRPGSDF